MEAKASSLAKTGHASTSISHAWRGVHRFGGFVLKTIGGVWWFRSQNYRRRFDGLDLKTIGYGFDRFVPQNRGVVDRRTRGGISKLASRRSDVEKALGPLNR